MKLAPRILLICAIGCVINAAPVMAATSLITFGFTDLRADYDLGTRLLDINEKVGGAVHTNGDVTRLVQPNAGSSATFDFSDATIALGDVDVDLTLGTLSGGQIPATGTVTITDINGDQITATTDGIFRVSFSNEVQYEGLLRNVGLPANMFDGTTGSIDISPGSFSATTFSGAVILIDFVASGPSGLAMFESSFSGGSVRNFDGSIVPAPAAAMLATMGMAAGLRRRRRSG